MRDCVCVCCDSCNLLVVLINMFLLYELCSKSDVAFHLNYTFTDAWKEQRGERRRRRGTKVCEVLKHIGRHAHFFILFITLFFFLLL